MAGNQFGQLFVITTCGESHGLGYMAIVDGCPPGLTLSEADIQKELDRRRPGAHAYATQRQEADRVQILSGVFEGRTTGTPIGLLIWNENQRERDYVAIKDVYRPGHADITYQQKYGIRDYRGGGRASARETVMRVAAGAIAKKYLAERMGITVQGYLAALGHIVPQNVDWSVIDNNPFFFPDADRVADCEALIVSLRREGDSIGARVNVVARGMPVGLGEPVFNKLNADIAHAMMGISAVKGVEIGEGFDVVTRRGTEHRDAIGVASYASNRAGGVLGGISTGQDVLVSLAFKPTSSIISPVASVDIQGNPVEVVTKGRHDPCVGIRAVPIVEAMLALVLMDHVLRDRAQNIDVERVDVTS